MTDLKIFIFFCDYKRVTTSVLSYSIYCLVLFKGKLTIRGFYMYDKCVSMDTFILIGLKHV